MTNWIKTRRQQLHMTQGDLAQQLQIKGFDVSRGTVSHWEMERGYPPLDNPDFANALSEIFRMSVVDLLISAGYDLPKQYTDLAQRAADLVNKMPPHRQSTAIGILEQLLGEVG